MGFYVLDVSSYQNPSLITRESKSIGGVIVKATQGLGYVNPLCNAQYNEAKHLGKMLGIYHYAEGNNPVSEADYFIKSIKNYVHKAVLVLDWERYQNRAWGSSEWAERFVNRVHELTGVWPLLYTGVEGLSQCRSLVNKCGLWIAYYYQSANTVNQPWSKPAFNVNIAPWKNYTLWQFSSKGGTMDMSYADLDAKSWARLANPTSEGSSKDPKPKPKPKTSNDAYSVKGKTLGAMANDVINGKVSSGDKRKQLLGKYYDYVQAIVNNKTGKASADSTVSKLVSGVQKGVFGNGDSRKNILGGWYSQVQSKIDGPSYRYYTVKSGDTLYDIGSRLGVNWTKLASYNGIHSPYTIQVGQKIKY